MIFQEAADCPLGAAAIAVILAPHSVNGVQIPRSNSAVRFQPDVSFGLQKLHNVIGVSFSVFFMQKNYGKMKHIRMKGAAEMGKIYFASDLAERTLKALTGTHEDMDVMNDLNKIQQTIQCGTNEQAGYLDREMRQKYPMIGYMLQTTNRFPARPARYYVDAAASSYEKSNLEQDYWGILCDTAIKKGIKGKLEDCIDHVEVV